MTNAKKKPDHEGPQRGSDNFEAAHDVSPSNDSRYSASSTDGRRFAYLRRRAHRWLDAEL